MFSNIYKNKKILLTGHTGFKGSWLSQWLTTLGSQVVGISLPAPHKDNHFELLRLDVETHNINIQNEEAITKKIREIEPDIVFHLAAQSLVHNSYIDPIETWKTNVIGTANILNACRSLNNLAAIVVVTSDKCYLNKEWPWGYRENDPLGGHDPYSASKGGCELVAASYRSSFFNASKRPLLATARAGNVIGGGDWSKDRLIPDLYRSMRNKSFLHVRSPDSTRPWQHVLECLSGYLLLGQRLLEGNSNFANAWNFGPDSTDNITVSEMLSTLKKYCPSLVWKHSNEKASYEAKLLHLDSSKSRKNLNWKPVWSLEEAVSATADWYSNWIDHSRLISGVQLQKYTTNAKERNCCWANRYDA